MRKLREQEKANGSLNCIKSYCQKEVEGNLETLWAPGDKLESSGKESGEVRKRSPSAQGKKSFLTIKSPRDGIGSLVLSSPSPKPER